MTDRRSFLAGLFAASLYSKPTWADAGSPAFLSAGLKPDGTYVLCGLTEAGDLTFEITLPARGHAAAAHPRLAHAVAFARRPGTYAVVVDCAQGRQIARLEAPMGRHFYGHGVFSADGDLLFTTENDFDNAKGLVGVWDARKDYARIAEFASGGVGPHEIKLMPDGMSLVVANGGIETHPDTGRAKLNIPTMRANLSFLNLDGGIRTKIELGPEHQRNSIRHLAVADNGTVAFGLQWQGDTAHSESVVGTYSSITGTTLFDDRNALGGYVGSIAITSDAGLISATSPRSGRAVEYSVANKAVSKEVQLEDICGVATINDQFIYTNGAGLAAQRQHETQWDNHLIKLKQ
ncbi:MAG: DUF1513 domain-containing protein [Pseudomonadota bacterium]